MINIGLVALNTIMTSKPRNYGIVWLTYSYRDIGINQFRKESQKKHHNQKRFGVIPSSPAVDDSEDSCRFLPFEKGATLAVMDR